MSDNQVKLSGDLPRIDSDEFGDFLHQWHADHNGNGKKPKRIKKAEPKPATIHKP